MKYSKNTLEKWTYFDAAKKCQEHIRVTTGKDSFAWKCLLVLDQLAVETARSLQFHGRENDMSESVRGNGIRQESSEHSRDYQTDDARRHSGQRGPHGNSSLFGGEWNDMVFVSALIDSDLALGLALIFWKDQTAPGGGILGSLFGNDTDGIHVRRQDSLVDRIDRWGFSSLTGY